MLKFAPGKLDPAPGTIQLTIPDTIPVGVVSAANCFSLSQPLEPGPSLLIKESAPLIALIVLFRGSIS